MTKHKILVGLGAAAMLAAGSSFAQGLPSTATATSGPAGFPVGPMTVYPGIDLAVGHDDNLFLRETNKSSSDFTVLSPYIRAEGKPGPHKFDITFRIDDGRYHQSEADSYTDYFLLGNGDFVFTGRAGLKLRAEFRHGHDPRGSTDRAASASPDEWDNSGIDGVFRYGAPGAQGRIEVDAGAFRRRYTNNRVTTAASDRDTSQLGGTFFWRVMPKTELLAKLGWRDINYQLAGSTQSSTETLFHVGVKWEATAATTGLASFGRTKKDFDSATRQDDSYTSWNVGVRWSPRTYSVFDFVTARQSTESTGLGDSIRSSNYGVTWNHAWSSRLRTTALASFRNDDYQGAGVTRKDETGSLGLKLTYDFRRWLRLGAEYTYFDRDSNAAGFDYKRNLYLFTAGFTL
jgi:hypothetical protein